MLGKRDCAHNLFKNMKRERHLVGTLDGFACAISEDRFKCHKKDDEVEKEKQLLKY